MSKINYQKVSAAVGAVAVFALPALAFAQGVTTNSEGSLGNIKALATNVAGIIGILIPAAFALAVLAFFWGVAKYIFSAGDEESKGQGQRIMIGGVIGIFVIAMIWGLVGFLGNTLGISNTTKGVVPTVKGNVNANGSGSIIP